MDVSPLLKKLGRLSICQGYHFEGLIIRWILRNLPGFGVPPQNNLRGLPVLASRIEESAAGVSFSSVPLSLGHLGILYRGETWGVRDPSSLFFCRLSLTFELLRSFFEASRTDLH